MEERWTDLEECRGWIISNTGIVKKKKGSLRTAKLPIRKSTTKYYYSFMKGATKKYFDVVELTNKYYPEIMLTILQIKDLRNAVAEHRPPSAFKSNIKSLHHKSNIRRCATCGKPTTQYRCDACWEKLRKGADFSVIGNTEASYRVIMPYSRG